MKTVTVSAPGLSGGGAERVASFLANYFDDKGYKVYFVAHMSPKRQYKLNDSISYSFIGKCNGRGLVSVILRMIKIWWHLKITNTDVFISFNILDNLIACISGRYKKIFSLRNDPNNIFNTIVKKWRTNFIYRHADKIVFQTEDARQYFAKTIQSKGTIIYNPIMKDLPYWNENNHEKVIITACRLEPQKNLRLMIDAFALFLNQHPNYTLNIFGEGSLKKDLESYIVERNLEKYVKLRGQSKKIFDEYLKSEMFVLSSDYEGISNAMLEALAIGLPVVCTDCPVGGARTFIHTNENGILTTVGSVDELAQGISRVADDPELRKKFSVASVKVRELLDIKEICKQWEDLF